MRKEKSKVLSLVAIALFCMLLGMKVGTFIFGILAIVKGVKYWQDPDRMLKNRIVADASRWEVEIPNSNLVRKKIFGLYRRIQKKERREPVFISSFSLILDEFWQQAGSFETEVDWITNLEYLNRNVPKTTFDKNTLSEALSDMQNLNLQLEKATVEVRR